MHFKYIPQGEVDSDSGVNLPTIEHLVDFVRENGAMVLTPNGTLIGTQVEEP